MRKQASKLLFMLFITISFDINETIADKSKCEICNDIVDNFNEGVKNTEKSNFGGGNTKWEEARSRTYNVSETRLIEVMENLCKEGDKMCHTLLEEYEELVEKFWFTEFAKKTETDMKVWLCISNMKVCCRENTFGPNCKDCPGGTVKPCSGNGDCEGQGTRGGSGKCNCHSGYQGDLCDICKDGYFEESKNESDIKCTACHPSCQSTCWEVGPKGCDECKEGWLQTEEEGCKDIDECTENQPCGPNQYCSNTEGSYYCGNCHSACTGCTQYGNDKCTSCNEGYRMEGEACTDIDECTEDDPKVICPGEHRTCTNTAGSFSCNCETGYSEEDGQCIKTPEKPPKPKTSSKTEKSSAKGKRKKHKRQKPSLSELGIAIALYGLLGKLVKGNVPIVIALTIAFASYLYWFASEYDRF